jgi:YesN/AraC family two-component response regulator
MVNVVGFEDYLIDECGNVFSKKRNKFLKPDLSGDGYPRYTFSFNGKTTRVFAHRIVASLFVDNPFNKPFVNHKDGNKQNNHYSNLEWVTTSENNAHAYKTGLKSQHGEKNHRSKYTQEQIESIHTLNIEGLNVKEIASKVSINPEYVSRVLNGDRWGEVWTKYNTLKL